MVSTIVQVARGQLLHVLVAASVEHMDRFGAFEVWIPGEPGNWRKEWLILMSWVGLGHVWRFGVVIGLAEETTDSMVLRRRIIATSYRNSAGRGVSYQLSTLLTPMRSI